MDIERYRFIYGLPSSMNKQEIAVTLVKRINSAIEALDLLGIEHDLHKVCYHHYSEKVESPIDNSKRM